MIPVRVREIDGRFVLEDKDGQAFADSDSLTDLLDEALPLLDVAKRSRVMPDGVMRWLDAASEERAEEFPDGHIDAGTLEELAEYTNRSPMPAPVDGGAVVGMLPSPVHGSAHDSGTPANGWVHAAAIVIRDGSTHLYLRAELLPEIATEVDRGRIAFGSVLVQASSLSEAGALRGAVLSGHALTNNPANRRLAPSTAVRESSEPRVLVMRSGPTLLQHGYSMSKSKTKAAAVTEPTEPTEPVVAERADEPSDAPPADAAPDKDALLAELEAKVAELQAQVDALLADAEMRAAAEPSEEDLAAKAQAEREAVASELVEDAIARGKIYPATRDAWMSVARSDPEKFTQLTKNLRAVPQRQAKPAEAIKTSARMLDKKDPYVVAMRAAGVADAEIERRLAARAKEI